VTPLFDRALQRHRLCGVCGALLQKTSRQENSRWATGDKRAVDRGDADIVNVSPLAKSDDTQFRIGDVVAIDFRGALRVKRIAALQGDVVTVPGGRVCVNDRRLEDLMALAAEASSLPPASLIVDRDSRQSKTRWIARNPTSTWKRSEERQWTFDTGSNDAADDSDWLIYHHRDVHNNEVAGRVLDDYQFNLTVARRLVPVDRLAVAANAEDESRATLQAAFWTPEGQVFAQGDLNQAGPASLQFHNAAASLRSEFQCPVLDALTPVAIRLKNARGKVRLSHLSVDRLIEYRLRPSDDCTGYPMRINAGEVFVVGDNVPVSEDSRVWGALSLSNVVGRVEGIASGRMKPQAK
jgi:type IV secretory pathway protease TraF